MMWLQRLKERLRTKRDRRKSGRKPAPLVAYFWSGGNAIPHAVQDVSGDGAFIRAQEKWGIGTAIQMYLCEEETGLTRTSSLSSISVIATVVRHDVEGMGLEFYFSTPKRRRAFGDYVAAVRSRHNEEKVVLRRVASEGGHSLVQFILLLPMLFLLIVNAVNFGSFLFAWITVANAARTASQYAVMAGATVTSPRAPTASQIQRIIAQDMSSLLNRSSLAVRLCTNNAGTITCTTSGTGTFTNPAADTRAEANLYVMAWVDVLYTYQPLIPLFNFSRLGVHATLPTTRIHRQSVMRMLQ